MRNHGFCGDWTGGNDTPMLGTDEPYPPVETTWPDWLPEEFRNGYLGYLQQYTHNVNLMRWFLDADGDVEVKAVDLDRAGLAGVVVLQVGGCRAVLESGALPYHGWEESHADLLREGLAEDGGPAAAAEEHPGQRRGLPRRRAGQGPDAVLPARRPNVVLQGGDAPLRPARAQRRALPLARHGRHGGRADAGGDIQDARGDGGVGRRGGRPGREYEPDFAGAAPGKAGARPQSLPGRQGRALPPPFARERLHNPRAIPIISPRPCVV